MGVCHMEEASNGSESLRFRHQSEMHSELIVRNQRSAY